MKAPHLASLAGLAVAAFVSFSAGSPNAAAQAPASGVPQIAEIKPVMAEPSAAKPRAATRHASRRLTAKDHVHVYLFRGLLNVFSLGMDDLANKIRAMGIEASVDNHSDWQSVADRIAADYKAGNHAPIILIGHSLGADAIMFMADYLGKRGVPVALLIPFDGTQALVASSNVARVLNFTQRDYAYARRGAGFHGELQNMDVSASGVDHLNIDKSERLHAIALAKIATVVKKGEVPTEFAIAPEEKERAKAAPKPAAETGHHAPKTTANIDPVQDSEAAPPAASSPAESSPAVTGTAAPVSTPASAPDVPAPQPVAAAPAPKPVAPTPAKEHLEYEKLPAH